MLSSLSDCGFMGAGGGWGCGGVGGGVGGGVEGGLGLGGVGDGGGRQHCPSQLMFHWRQDFSVVHFFM